VQKWVFLLLVIPKEHEGALEMVILDYISEKDYDKNIVKKCKQFVDEIKREASNYISSKRKQLKALLGVTWAIQYPEKTFSLIDEQLKNVCYENSQVLKECFGPLVEI